MKLDRFRTPEEQPAFPLTAMIDVLFLMIIFLVLGANFEPLGTVELPEAGGAAPPPSAVRVVLDAAGNATVDGRPLTPETVGRILAAPPPPEILLLPDRRLDVGALFRWYDLLTRELRVPVRVGVTPPSAQ